MNATPPGNSPGRPGGPAQTGPHRQDSARGGDFQPAAAGGNAGGVPRRSRSVLEWPWALVPVCCSAFLLTALAYYHLYHEVLAVQTVAQVVVAGCYRTFGFAPSVLFAFVLLVWSSLWVFAGRIERPLARLCHIAGMAIMLGVLFNLGSGPLGGGSAWAGGGAGGVAPALHKGELGALLAGRMVDLFGYYPTLLLVVPVTLASILLATDFFFSERIELWRQRRQPAEQGVEAEAAEVLRSLGGVEETAALVAEPTAQDAAAPSLRMAAPRPAATEGATGTDEGVDVQPAEDPVEPARYPGVRQSAYERRQAARVAEEEWVPAAPDAQEIDNPETALALPLDGEAGAVEAAAVPTVAPTVEQPTSSEPVPMPEPPAAAADSVAEAVAADDVVAATVAMPPVVPIPRPETLAREPKVQQQLFQPAIDEALLADAVELVTSWRRASATLLQRRLRIDYALACQVLAILATRGVIELEADAAHGRVRES